MDRAQFVRRRVRECWDTAASSYDDTPGHGLRTEEERRAWYAPLRDVLPPAPCDVLDAGTGTGFLALRARELGYRVAGVDLSERMWRAARAAAPDAGLAFVVGDAAFPPFAAASFDAVITRHLLWTLERPDEALRAWHGALRPGGRLLVVDGLWSHDGADADDADDAVGDDDDDHPGADFYTPEVLERLPLTRVDDVAEIVRLIESAGYRDVRHVDLAAVASAEGELEWTDRRYALAARRA